MPLLLNPNSKDTALVASWSINTLLIAFNLSNAHMTYPVYLTHAYQ